MECNIALSQKNREVMSLGLNRLLADTYAIYLKTQNFHWNLEGQEFYSLHILFEKQYEEMADAIDEIAERIRALGFYVEASLSSFKKLSLVKDDDKLLSIKEMLSTLVESHEILICHARKLAEIGDNEKDFATVDLVGRRLGVHEKFAWMLRASQ